MSFSSLIADLYRNLSSQKLRSFLTIFGIMWGTATLILLLAFGMGFRDQTVLNMRGMGDQIAIVWGGQTTKAYEGYGIGRPIRLREADAWMLQNEISDIEIALPEYSRNFTVSNSDRRRDTQVGGVYTEYSNLRNIYEQQGGRWINERDISDRRRVVFLGNQLAENLFGEEDPIGQYVMLNQTPFIVIGVMQSKVQNSSYSQRDHDRAFIPATTFSAMTGTDMVNNILYVPKDPQFAPAVMDQVYEVMGRKYQFDSSDRDAIAIWDTNEFWAFVDVLFYGINGFLGLIGFFTLAVGGIGVANIMFVVVQERMMEIGVRRSAGARRHHIMIQFFMETFMIVGVGAAAGYLTGWLLVEATQNIPIKEFVGAPHFSPEVGILAFVVLGIVGFASGLLPAWRASRLNIIDCIRR